MIGIATVFSVVLALAVASSSARKFSNHAASERLRQRLRVAPALWRTVGVLELCASIGLLVGLAAGPLGVTAAVGIALIMLGAVLLHLRAGIAGLALVAPLVVLLLGTTTAAFRFAAL